jgi:hypothetical protein
MACLSDTGFISLGGKWRSRQILSSSSSATEVQVSSVFSSGQIMQVCCLENVIHVALSHLNNVVPLQALAAAARVDKEEWVGIMGRAVGNFDGQLDLDAVVKGMTAVSIGLHPSSHPADTCCTSKATSFP